MKQMSRISYVFAIGVLAAALAACSNTAQGVAKDTERATEKVAAGVETMDVKAALIADGTVDASNINVDTNAATKTVVLKGSVPTAEQRSAAEKIAMKEAPGYKIDNQLTVAAKPKG